MFSFDGRFGMFDVTPVENMFLQEYMPGASGDFIKVYLYGLMQCYHPTQSMSIEVMAKDLAIRFQKNTEQLYAGVINALFEAPQEETPEGQRA